MIKEKKGITMVTLVVTIIVLMILSMISINALVGENGIISRAIESRIVSILADIIFDIESNIIDINADNLVGNLKYTATETIQKLQEKDILSRTETQSFWKDLNNLTMQSKVNDSRLNNLSLAYNGDLWLDNYKRGKIQLSSNYNVINSTDGLTKITVIDGTITECVPSIIYELKALEDRDDFICWVNQYGEIVSSFPETNVIVGRPGEVEYTAIYAKELKELFNTTNYSFENYLKWFNELMETEETGELIGNNGTDHILGIESIGYILNDRICIEFDATINRDPYVVANTEEALDNPKIEDLNVQLGCEPFVVNVYFSTDYQDLIVNGDDLNANENKSENAVAYTLLNEDMIYNEWEPLENGIGTVSMDSINGLFEQAYNDVDSDFERPLGTKIEGAGEYYWRCISKENLRYSNSICYFNGDFMDLLNEEREKREGWKNSKRLYYRAELIFFYNFAWPEYFSWGDFEYIDESSVFCQFEPTIKYIEF